MADLNSINKQYKLKKDTIVDEESSNLVTLHIDYNSYDKSTDSFSKILIDPKEVKDVEGKMEKLEVPDGLFEVNDGNLVVNLEVANTILTEGSNIFNNAVEGSMEELTLPSPPGINSLDNLSNEDKKELILSMYYNTLFNLETGELNESIKLNSVDKEGNEITPEVLKIEGVDKVAALEKYLANSLNELVTLNNSSGVLFKEASGQSGLADLAEFENNANKVINFALDAAEVFADVSQVKDAKDAINLFANLGWNQLYAFFKAYSNGLSFDKLYNALFLTKLIKYAAMRSGNQDILFINRPNLVLKYDPKQKYEGNKLELQEYTENELFNHSEGNKDLLFDKLIIRRWSALGRKELTEPVIEANRLFWSDRDSDADKNKNPGLSPNLGNSFSYYNMWESVTKDGISNDIYDVQLECSANESLVELLTPRITEIKITRSDDSRLTPWISTEFLKFPTTNIKFPTYSGSMTVFDDEGHKVLNAIRNYRDNYDGDYKNNSIIIIIRTVGPYSLDEYKYSNSNTKKFAALMDFSDTNVMENKTTYSLTLHIIGDNFTFS